MEHVKGKRVAVLVEKFYEDLEFWYPVLRLREAGCDVKIVGPKAGETYASKHGYPAKADTTASEVKARDFDAIVIPGGYSPDHMRRHKAMVDLVTQAARQGKVLAAICHGPWMLCSAKCLKGRKVTGFFAIRDDVENAGVSGRMPRWSATATSSRAAHPMTSPTSCRESLPPSPSRPGSGLTPSTHELDP